MSDVIVVRIPASTAHVALVRAAASALAARLNFTYDRITDLHIAIDEVCSRILASSEPAPSQLQVTFDVAGDGLQVTARGDAPAKPGTQFLNRWSEMILESVTDHLEVLEADGTSIARFAVGRGEGA